MKKHKETILLFYFRNITGRNEFLKKALIGGHSLSYKHNIGTRDDEEVFGMDIQFLCQLKNDWMSSKSIYQHRTVQISFLQPT